MCFSMHLFQRVYFKDIFPGKTSPIRMRKMKFLVKFLFKTRWTASNEGMKENLFTYEHVNIT